jgi:hypothetical protein
LAILDAGVFAGFQESRQKRVLAAEANEHEQVSAIHLWHEARLHGNPVRIFDAGCQAEDLNVVAADIACEIGQVGERCDNADFGRRVSRDSRERRGRDCRGQEQMERIFHDDLSFSLLALLPAVGVRPDDPGPLEVDGVVGFEWGGALVVGVGVLQPKLIPMAQGISDVR